MPAISAFLHIKSHTNSNTHTPRFIWGNSSWAPFETTIFAMNYARLAGLIVLCAVMAVTSFLAGQAPLVAKISNTQLSRVRVLSMGLLVGTALAVVVPEGVETIYDADIGHMAAKTVGIALSAGFLLMFLLDNIASMMRDTHVFTPLKEDSLVAAKLVLVAKTPLTVGLLLHSAVDGIALALSFAKADTLGVLFFVVIIVHKLPTAFSLTTLLAEQMPKLFVTVHLAVFSLITPATALMTYVVVLFTDISDLAIGILLIFSAGTFLYIVTHVMLEVLKETPPSSGDSDDTFAPCRAPLTSLELLLAAVGMVVPVLMSLLGGH